MAERRRFLIAGNHLPMRLVQLGSRTPKPITLPEAKGLDNVNPAIGANSSNPSPILSSSVSASRP